MTHPLADVWWVHCVMTNCESKILSTEDRRVCNGCRTEAIARKRAKSEEKTRASEGR